MLTPEEKKAQEEIAAAKAAMEQIAKKTLADNPELKEVSTLKAELAKINEGIKACATAEEVKGFKSQIEELGLKMKAMTEGGKPSENKSWKEQVKEQYHKQKAEIDKALSGQKYEPIRFQIKAASDTIQVDNTIGAGDTQVSITQNTGIISAIRTRLQRYLEVVSTGRIGTSFAMWIEERSPEGTPIFLGEGDSKTQLTVKYAEQTKQVKKIAVFSKVTTEMMADLPQLISYIENNLVRRMNIAIEDQLIDGDDTGDNLMGARKNAVAFAPSAEVVAAITDSTQPANVYDVLRAAANQVEEAFGVANAALVHPSAIAAMDVSKTVDGLYVRPNWATTDQNIAGLRIVPTLAIGADEFIVGDMKVLQVLFREDATIQIGLDGNDFTENKKTILMETRLVQFISSNDLRQVVAGTFTHAKTLLGNYSS